MITNIQPIEVDGQHYVDVMMDGKKNRYGPYLSVDEAEAMTRRIAAVCRGLFHSGTHIHHIGAAPRKQRHR